MKNKPDHVDLPGTISEERARRLSRRSLGIKLSELEHEIGDVCFDVDTGVWYDYTERGWVPRERPPEEIA